MRTTILLVFAATAAASLLPSARAQARGQVVIHADGGQYGFPDDDDPERVVWVFLGGVRVEEPSRRLFGETVVAVLRRSGTEAGGATERQEGFVFSSDRLLELYADGDVTLEEGDELVLGAGGVLIDNVTGVVHVVEGAWRTEARNAPLVIRFGLLRELPDGTRDFEQAEYTTCEYAHTHWGIETVWARLTPTPDGRVLRTGRQRGRVGGVTVVQLPGLHLNVDRERPPLRRVGFGTSRKFGTEINTVWGFDASRMVSDVGRALGHEGPLEGDFELELNSYSSRGPFIEPIWEWESETTRGRLRTAYIEDDNDEDIFGNTIEDRTRGRIDLENRVRLDEHRVVDVELSYLSDRDFLTEFYEGEARIGKPQESYVNYRDVRGNEALSVLARARVNDFDTRVEYLPRLERRRVGEVLDAGPLGRPVLSAIDFVDSVRLAAEEEPLTAPPQPAPQPASARNTRLGMRRSLAWPFDVGGDRIVVRAEVDLTAFDETGRETVLPPAGPTVTTADDGSEVRWALLGGAEWSRTYSGTSDHANAVWNLDGIRQILEPRIGYRNVFELSRTPTKLTVIDDVERLDKVQAFDVGLRHRIQTHQGGRVATILETDVSMPVFTNEDRDNIGPNTVPVEPRGNTKGNIFLESIWRPGADLPGLRTGRFRIKEEYDPNTGTHVRQFLSYSASFGGDKRLVLSRNKATRVDTDPATGQFDRTMRLSKTINAGIQWPLTDRWTAATFVSFDQLRDEQSRAGILLRQRAHRWLIDLELSRRQFVDSRGGLPLPPKVRDEYRFSISLRPAVFVAEDEPLLTEISRIGNRRRY